MTIKPNEAHATAEKVPVGILPLDNELGGRARAGTFNLICAYTGDGKSSLVIHLAPTAASLGHPVMIYHYEMACEDYLGRLESWESGVAYSQIRGVNSNDPPPNQNRLSTTLQALWCTGHYSRHPGPEAATRPYTGWSPTIASRLTLNHWGGNDTRSNALHRPRKWKPITLKIQPQTTISRVRLKAKPGTTG